MRPYDDAVCALAFALAREAHAGQVDKAGVPYIEHVQAVANAVAATGARPSVVAAALLHDVLEDTPVSPEDLRDAGIPEEVIRVVKRLTRASGVPYIDYVRDVARDPDARAVKLADNAHNAGRLDALPPEVAQSLSQRYAQARRVLIEADT